MLARRRTDSAIPTVPLPQLNRQSLGSATISMQPGQLPTRTFRAFDLQLLLLIALGTSVLYREATLSVLGLAALLLCCYLFLAKCAGYLILTQEGIYRRSYLFGKHELFIPYASITGVTRRISLMRGSRLAEFDIHGLVDGNARSICMNDYFFWQEIIDYLLTRIDRNLFQRDIEWKTWRGDQPSH